MNKNLIQIDVSNSRLETDESITKIKLRNEDIFQFNITNLFIQSKYIRDKYKFSEVLNSLQLEIKKIEENFNISDESIKLFFQLVQNEKINIPLNHYKDFYELSEYFCIQKVTSELDKVYQRELLKDLNFTIQILIDSETATNNLETKLTSKIETFLKERINECIENTKFRELSVSTISRILNKSKESFNQNLLLNFILESAKTHFILFKFIELHKLTDEKVEELIEFIDKQDENSKKLYLEYIPFNLSFIKNMKNKYDKLVNEMNQAKIQQKQTNEELKQMKNKYDKLANEMNQTKIQQEQTNEELKQMKDKYDKLFNEMNQAKIQQEQTNEELEQMKDKYDKLFNKMNQTEKDLKKSKKEMNKAINKQNRTIEELEKTKEELYQCQNELKKTKDELDRINTEKKNQKRDIVVGGYNKYKQLGEKSNNKDKNNSPIISPPLILSFDPSQLLSYSVYDCHLVLVTNNNLLKGIGKNEGGQLSSSLQKIIIDQLTEFSIKDSSGFQLNPISALSYSFGTLYMFSKRNGDGRQLVLCDKDINQGDPVFLDIGNQQPVAIFGGGSHLAAIGSEGEVIFINRYSVIDSPRLHIPFVFLPDDEKASSVACCKDSVIALSLNGRVFISPVENRSSVLKFSEVAELAGKEIISVSGTNKHSLVVSKDGHVFGRGSNNSGQLGLGEDKSSTSEFTEILSLNRYKIRAAYAGGFHSLFETCEGKIISCGWNINGQLLISSGPSDYVYSPTETIITGGATFCIAGWCLSAVFIGNGPPLNTPNMRLLHIK